MSDSIADDILRSGYDRWLRLEEEKAAISDDLKELMAELKGQGFTPKALRESFRRVRYAGDAAIEEHDALVDLYVTSLTRDTRVRAREIIEEFPADHHPQPHTEAGLPEVTASGERITEPAHSDPSGVAADAGFDPASEAEEAAPVSSATPMQEGSEPTEAHNLGSAGSTPAPATISTEASQERAQTATGVGTGGDNLGPASRSSAPAKTDAPTDQSQASGDGQSQHNSGVRVASVGTQSPHPACKRPALCGGYSNLALCQSCKEAAGLTPVVAGGVEVEHHGQVH